MSTNTPIKSAQILQFPVRGRRDYVGPLKSTTKAPDLAPAAGKAIAAAGGSGWYHDAAMLDGDPARR